MKWAEAIPLRNMEAVTIAKVLVEHSALQFHFVVDRRIMREACRLFGIEKLRTLPYKPSMNQVERFHKTMNAILAKTLTEHQKDWDVRLLFAMAAYRASRHEASGYSQNFLVLGRRVRNPVDTVYGSVDEDCDKSYDHFVENVRERMTAAFAEVRETLRRSAERNKSTMTFR